MKKDMADACLSCECLKKCYTEGFLRCPRIEIATKGLGIPYKPKQDDDSYLKNVPFGVHQALKHIIESINKDEKKFIGRW